MGLRLKEHPSNRAWQLAPSGRANVLLRGRLQFHRKGSASAWAEAAAIKMKFFCISDNIDTQMGMRLAGIEGVVVHEADEVHRAVDTALQDKEIGIILVSEKLVKLCYTYIYDLKLNVKQPLIVEIPDRHGNANISENIANYVRDAIGIEL